MQFANSLVWTIALYLFKKSKDNKCYYMLSKYQNELK